MNAQDTLSTITNLLANQNLIGRIFIVFLAALYTLFAFILNRQISLLSGMVNQVSFSPVLKLVSLIHLIIAVGILLYAAFLL